MHARLTPEPPAPGRNEVPEGRLVPVHRERRFVLRLRGLGTMLVVHS